MADSPNILLFVIESQRTNNMTVYGHDKHTTPHLESLAADGMVFDQHITSSPWCLGAYASLHTGKYASSHGATSRFECLTAEYPTLAEILARHGYQSGGFSCNSYVSEAVDLHRGFDTFEFFKAVQGQDEDKGAEEMERRVSRWLEGVERQKPFFLFINCNEPHYPYWAPEPYRFLFLPPGNKLTPEYLKELSARAHALPDINPTPLSPEEWPLVKGLYDGETAHADGALGAVMDALRKRDLFQDTLIVVTSDHGDDQGEHVNFLTHAFFLHRTVLHVPLVMRLPGRIPAGKRYSGLSQPEDLFPTILTLAGLDNEEWHEGLQGVNLSPAFESQPSGREIAVAEYVTPLQKLERDLRNHELPSRFMRKFQRSLKSIEDGCHKFIWASDGSDQLYDVQADPGEMKNLIEEQPEKARELYQKLDQWLMKGPHRDYGDALSVHPVKGVRKDNLRRLEAWGLLRRLHEIPFGSGEFLSDSIPG